MTYMPETGSAGVRSSKFTYLVAYFVACRAGKSLFIRHFNFPQEINIYPLGLTRKTSRINRINLDGELATFGTSLHIGLTTPKTRLVNGPWLDLVGAFLTGGPRNPLLLYTSKTRPEGAPLLQSGLLAPIALNRMGTPPAHRVTTLNDFGANRASRHCPFLTLANP